MYHSIFIHSSIDGHLGCFHVLATVNSAAVNIGVHVSFSILVSLGCMPISGIIGSYCGFIPSFLKNLWTIFDSGCINLHSHGQCKSIPLSPHPFQPMGIYCMIQGTQMEALQQPRGMGWGGRWEGGSRGKRHMYIYGWFM